MSGVEVVRVSERALLARFHDGELELAVAKAQRLFFKLRSEGSLEAGNEERLSLKGNEEAKKGERLPVKGRTVLGAGSVLVELPPLAKEGNLERLRERIVELAAEIDARTERSTGAAPETREHRVEVRFGGAEGVDLETLARELGRSAESVVALLCCTGLRVAFVGFAPGFPYLIGLPSELQVPRLASPRPRVPAGSVAIAGPFAGIYPSETPGGWRLLGRLAPGERALFDPLQDPPARFAPGDRVRFVSSVSIS